MRNLFRNGHFKDWDETRESCWKRVTDCDGMNEIEVNQDTVE